MSSSLLNLLVSLATCYFLFQLYLFYLRNQQCTDPAFCLTNEEILEDSFYSNVFNKVVLTESEERELIRRYGQIEHQIKADENCAIGVGYTTCMDINFRAVDLIQQIQDEVDKLDKERRIKPQVHEKIRDLREFLETFLYYFSRGANAERTTDSKVLFDYLLGIIQNPTKGIQHNSELGGHSSVWALRAQKEGCKAYIAAQPSDFNKRTLQLNNDAAQLYLQWPYEQIAQSQDIKDQQALDSHLVFEYQEGDIIMGYTAPRSNRFYFVDDPNGSGFRQMEIYHEHLKYYPLTQRHLFGGYQLMQSQGHEESKKRLMTQEKLWKEMRSRVGEDHRIHVEFAHFSNLQFFQLFEKYAVRHADSLGMNEQELGLLLDYWEYKLKDINQARESKPSIEEILEQLEKFFTLAKQRNFPVSRVHLHPYGSFLICYDKSKWEDAHDAIIKSAMVSPKFCMLTDKLEEEHLDNYDVPDLPKFFANPKNPGEVIPIRRDNLTYSFNLNDDIQCYLQFFLKCRSLYKTAGLGDTISSTGFIYHKPKSFNSTASE